MAALVEPVSLAVLLLNVFTVDIPGVADVMGPLHGSAYLIAIVATWAGRYTARARLLAWVPGVGGLLALRTEPTTRPDRRG